MRSVWQGTTAPRIGSSIQRAYWSEHDVVSHLTNDIEAVHGAQTVGALQLDWHLDFSLKPHLFSPPLAQKIDAFNTSGNYKKVRPDLIVNNHDDVSSPFLIHAEAKVWFGGDWQPTIQDLNDDLIRLDLSLSSGLCQTAVMIVVFDPQGQPVPKGVSIASICIELANHPNVKVLEYPLGMCQSMRINAPQSTSP